ncbi:helix-turn-helix transcriptional regulator [Burkholderia pseudomallei]|uniref:helix-turn-helix transcriptional regulator n=1 Tax=Burkholderia pseudomallei TaxID=28450 RepID=UPI000F2B43B9|nr:AlpA family transcriptional regulator [Burkholderia pseudomallei]VBD30876.1 prophage CP4-57 regulatory protein (AlpA) [Burkholderia pseudomallei]
MSTNKANADCAFRVESDQQEAASARSVGNATCDKSPSELFNVTQASGGDATTNAKQAHGKFDLVTLMAQLRAVLETVNIAMLSIAGADTAELVPQLKPLAETDGVSFAVAVSTPFAAHRMIPAGARVLRMRQLVEHTGLSRATLYALQNSDPTFPRKVHLTLRSVGWIDLEVDAWLASRIQLRAAA